MKEAQVLYSIVAATLAITKFAIESADAARTQGLLLAGIGRSAQGGRELATTIERLGNQVPLTSDELQSMASELANTGLRGQALSDALEVSAEKAARLKFGPDFAKQICAGQANRQQRLSGVRDASPRQEQDRAANQDNPR